MTDKSHGYAFELDTKGERFGWDPVEEAFIMEQEGQRRCLHMSIGLAEAFLRECLNKDFRERFLTDWAGFQQQWIEVEGARLFVYRGQINMTRCNNHMPKLFLRVEQEGRASEGLSLSHGLRKALADTLSALSAEDIHSHLYVQQAAA